MIGQGLSLFLFTTVFRPGLEAHAASYPVDRWGYFLRDKVTICEANHSPLLPRLSMCGVTPPCLHGM